MKKILLLTLEFPPDRGGVSRYYGGLVGAMPEGSVVVMRARLSHWIWPHWLPLFVRVAWKIYRDRVSEVWVGHLLPLGTVVYLLKKLPITSYQLPVTVFTHGMDVLLPQSSTRKTWFMKRIFSTADRVVTISQFTKGELLKLGVAEKKIVIIPPCSTSVPPLSISHRRWRGPASLKNNSGGEGGEGELRIRYHLGDKKILLTVARLVERKGIDLVLEALQQFPQTKSGGVIDFVYVVVGDGPERHALEVESRKYALSTVEGSKVIFVGAVGDDELAAWYEVCDVFIMTPRKIGPDVEGFGLVYLEANAFGKPVIGLRTGGVPEAVIDGETGLLVDEGDVDGIASAIKQLFSDDALRKKLGEQGRARVEREFQWEKQVKKIS